MKVLSSSPVRSSAPTAWATASSTESSDRMRARLSLFSARGASLARPRDDRLLVAHVGLVEAARSERLGRQALECRRVRRLGRRVEAAPVAVAAGRARRGHPHVRRDVVGEHHERSLAGPGVDVGDGPLVQAGGDVVVGEGVAAEEREVLVVGRRLEQDVEVVPPGIRRGIGVELVEVLAVDRGGVARVLGPRRDGRGRVHGLPAAVRPGVVVHVVVLGVLARHQLGPGRTAQRVWGLGLGERHALVDQQALDVGEVAEVVLAHVVGQEDQHVGGVGRGRSARRRRVHDLRRAARRLDSGCGRTDQGQDEESGRHGEGHAEGLLHSDAAPSVAGGWSGPS